MNDKSVNVITGKRLGKKGLKEKEKLGPIFFFGYLIYWITIMIMPLIRKKISRLKLDLVIIAETG